MALFNLFKELPEQAAAEEFLEVLHHRNIRIERIFSPPHSKTEWMIQEQDEWVTLLQGYGELELGSETQTLKQGDTLFIPAGTRHRVTDTSAEPCALWLAVHIHPTNG
jgi:cupin 2 domain-containing protein